MVKATDLLGAAFVRSEVDCGAALEMKVTLAASLMLSAFRCDGSPEKGRVASIQRVLGEMDAFEPLHPFIGHDEWEDIGPPRSLYLLEREAHHASADWIVRTFRALQNVKPDISGADVARAAFFHLDNSFRRGVAAMVGAEVERMKVGQSYLPAIYLGNARPDG